MIRSLIVVGGFFAAFAAFVIIARSDERNFVVLGNDRLELIDRRTLDRAGQATLSACFKNTRPIKAGRPFRKGVELAYEKAWYGESLIVHLNDVYDRLWENNMSYFIDKVETEQDMKGLLSTIYRCPADDWLSPDQLRYVLNALERAPKELPISVLSRQFDADLLAKRCFRRDKVWCAAIAIKGLGGRIDEIRYAIDEKNRVAESSRTRVQGAPIELVGKCPFYGACDIAMWNHGEPLRPGEPRAVKLFHDTDAYVSALIAESKKRSKR